MRIAIFGATGVVGTHLAAELSKKHDVITVSRNSAASNFRFDASDARQLEKFTETARPDVVINAIKAQISTDKMEAEKELAFAMDVLLPERLARLAEKSGFKMVQISSDWVYEGKEGETYGENSLTYPKNYYAYTKAIAEERVAAHAKDHIIVRTEGIFGIDEHGTNPFLRLKESDKSKREVLLATDQYSQPICGSELARLVAILLEKNAMGIYNVVGPDYLSRYELGIKICKRFDFDANLVPFLVKERTLPVPTHLRISTAKMENLVGKARTLEEQFDAFEAEWLRDGAKA